jgi:hypothetical protein
MHDTLANRNAHEARVLRTQQHTQQVSQVGDLGHGMANQVNAARVLLKQHTQRLFFGSNPRVAQSNTHSACFGSRPCVVKAKHTALH